jgi:hypothetical protein
MCKRACQDQTGGRIPLVECDDNLALTSLRPDQPIGIAYVLVLIAF